jgi:hypothetical protein
LQETVWRFCGQGLSAGRSLSPLLWSVAVDELVGGLRMAAIHKGVQMILLSYNNIIRKSIVPLGT